MLLCMSHKGGMQGLPSLATIGVCMITRAASQACPVVVGVLVRCSHNRCHGKIHGLLPCPSIY